MWVGKVTPRVAVRRDPREPEGRAENESEPFPLGRRADYRQDSAPDEAPRLCRVSARELSDISLSFHPPGTSSVPANG